MPASVTSGRNAQATSDACPSPDTVIRFVGRTMPPEERERFEIHIDRCPRCRGLVGEAVDSTGAPSPAIALATRVGPVTSESPAGDPDTGPRRSLRRNERRALERVGTVLRGKYRIDGLLGAGGMACVYVATHRNTKRFAVKVLHPEISLHEDLRDRFIREGYVANSVGHTGAVAVLDDDVTIEGEAFLVMELLDGEPLDQLCARLGGRLSPRLALAIAEALLDVLDAAHGKSIVHRDIKPSNLLLTSEGELKVLDFGIARIRDTSAVGATASGVILGTPGFMAPEQALARTDEIDGRTDVWSVGATLFSLLSGRTVHQASTPQEAVIWTATLPAGSLGVACPDIAPSVVGLVDKALAFAKSNRWQGAAAMREAVRQAFLELEGEPLSSAVLLSFAPAPRARIKVTVPAGASALGATAQASSVFPEPLMHATTIEISARAEGEPAWNPKSGGTTGGGTPSQQKRSLRAAGALVLVGALIGVGAIRLTEGRPTAPPPAASAVPQSALAPSGGALATVAATSAASGAPALPASASAREGRTAAPPATVPAHDPAAVTSPRPRVASPSSRSASPSSELPSRPVTTGDEFDHQ